MKLLVVADDFGVNEARSRGIVDAMKRGVVTAVSVIPNGACPAEMLEEARREVAGLHVGQVGLHVNLTEGRALAGVSSLTDSDGCFLGKMGLRTHERVEPADVERELAAQVAWINDLCDRIFDARPTHYDGHNHFHTDPRLSALVARTMAGLGYRSTRSPACITTAPHAVAPEAMTSQHVFHKHVAAEAADTRSVFASHGLRVPAAFFGLTLLEKCTAAGVVDAVREAAGLGLPADAVVEVMTHIGHTHTGAVPMPPVYHYDAFSTSPARAAEYDAWCSDAVRAAVGAFPAATFADV